MAKQISQHKKDAPGRLSGAEQKSLLVHIKPRDISPDEEASLLTSLNCFKTPEELRFSVQKNAGDVILSFKDAQRILITREQTGGFQALKQLSCVRGIGSKKFDLIMRALSRESS